MLEKTPKIVDSFSVAGDLKTFLELQMDEKENFP